MKLEEKRRKFYLSEKDYELLVLKCKRSMLLSDSEVEILLKNPVSKFLAGIPYLSGESEPDILAVMNLNSFIAGIRDREFFSQRCKERKQKRVDPYVHSVDGHIDTISFCKLVLEEVSLFDNYNNRKKKEIRGFSNPINIGLIDFESEKRRLNAKKTKYPKHVQILVDESFKGENI